MDIPPNATSATLLADLQSVIGKANRELSNTGLGEDERRQLTQQRDQAQKHRQALQSSGGGGGKPTTAITAAAFRALTDLNLALTNRATLMAKSASSRSLSSHPPSRAPSSTGGRGDHDRLAVVASGGPGGAAAQAAQHVLGKRKLQELVSQVDPLYRLEPAVEDLFLEVADEFIESVSHMACRLAKHRRGDTLEVRDVQMHLERHWNLRVPGFAADEIRSLRRPGNVSVHTQRLKAIAESKASRKPSGGTS